MIASLKILAEASIDIKEITAWYKNISPQLALRFVSQWYDGFEKIIANPNAWFNLTKRVKRYRLPEFPYLILFIKKDNNILVFAVMHEDEILKSGRKESDKDEFILKPVK